MSLVDLRTGDLIRPRQQDFGNRRYVRARTNPPTNMYRPKTYSKTKSSYGRKKPISQGKALATAKRHNFKVGVESVIKRQVEVKKAYLTQQVGATAYNQLSTMNVQTMIPYLNISQGTGQSNRIGNQIRTRKCIFRYVLNPLPYNATSNAVPVPQDVCIMFGVVKNSKAISPTAADFTKLFQEGNTSIPPTSDLRDLTRDFNSDLFTIRKVVRHKVGVAANAVGGGGTAVTQYAANNDYKYNVINTLDLTSICPAMLRFNDTTLQPTNNGLWMWIFAVPADGQTAANLGPLYYNWTVSYDFEDA